MTPTEEDEVNAKKKTRTAISRPRLPGVASSHTRGGGVPGLDDGDANTMHRRQVLSYMQAYVTYMYV